MKIIYCIAGTYRAAGMERVLANKTNALEEDGNEIVIVTTDQRGQKPAFYFDQSIRMIDLDVNYEDNNGKSFLNKLIHYPFKQLKHRRRLSSLLKEEKADIVVSMFCNDANFLPKIKDGSKKVLEIHFSRFKRVQYGRTGIWAFADKLRSRNDLKTVGRFDKFIVLTEEDKTYWGNLPNIQVIPNARTFKLDEPSDLDSKMVIAVGRYNFQKDLGKLLEAWAMTDRKDWKLWLVGEGEEKGSLENSVNQLGIGESVVFGKSQGDIKEVYRNASILALSSKYEGLPMVLLEAQAAGLPIVSFACKCGPKDVITEGKDGFLVGEGDVKGMSEKLSILINDDNLRKRMGAAAFVASNRFDEVIIMDKWRTLFRELL